MKLHILVCGLALMVSCVAAREINGAGLNLIKEVEGWRNCAYRDQVGAWTIGYGHLIVAWDGLCKPNPSPSCCISDQRGTEILRSDLKIATDCISRIVHVPLSDNQFAALVSWTFNVGIGAAARSQLVSRLNANDYNSVCDELKKYIYGGGRVIEGLVVRRQKECNLFLARVSDQIDSEILDIDQNSFEPNGFERDYFEEKSIDDSANEIDRQEEFLL